MSTLLQVLFYSLLGGLVSLVGGLLLISNRNRAMQLTKYATPFAAGALLAAAFTDLLPEGLHENENTLTFAMIGVVAFFVLERLLRSFHHHHDQNDKQAHAHDHNAPLVIIGDIMHNFIDGVAIAAGFLVDPTTGIIVTLAVAAHEIPQEIGDFGLLLHKGLSRRQVVQINILSALATVLAAGIFFQLGQSYELPLNVVLGLVAGFFIYVAVSDIIPTIHATKDPKTNRIQTALLIFGVVAVSVVTTLLHGYIDQGHDDHDEHSSHSTSETHDEKDHDEHDEDEHSDEEHAEEEHHDEHDDHHSDHDER